MGSVPIPGTSNRFSSLNIRFLKECGLVSSVNDAGKMRIPPDPSTSKTFKPFCNPSNADLPESSDCEVGDPKAR